MHRLPGTGAVAGLCVVLVAAGCGYRGGSFDGPRGQFAGTHVTVGCLDVGVSAAPSGAAPTQGPVIAYEFGNGCDKPTRVDLSAIVARGRTASGRELGLWPYDPKGELRAATLEARLTGREVIEYRGATNEPIVMACVDLWALDGAAKEPREVCLDVAWTHNPVAVDVATRMTEEEP